MFDLNRFKIGEKEKLEDILVFENKEGVLLPPSLLYLLLNHGEISYDYGNKHFYNSESYSDLLIDTIPSISTLKSWYDNHWRNLMSENSNLGNNFMPILSTYSSNIDFIVGVQDFNMDEVFIYDDDFESFSPIRICDNIFQLFKKHIEFRPDSE